MSKIKVFYSLKSPDENISKEISGIFKDNRIVYSDSSIKTVICLDDKLYMSRENKDYKFEFVFEDKKETKGIYTIKMYNYEMEIEIITHQLVRQDNSIDLKYELSIEHENCGIFEFKLKYELI